MIYYSLFFSLKIFLENCVIHFCLFLSLSVFHQKMSNEYFLKQQAEITEKSYRKDAPMQFYHQNESVNFNYICILMTELKKLKYLFNVQEHRNEY